MTKNYLHDKRGVVSIIFALSLTAILASAGVATDLALAYNAKSRLMSALDKAALAVGSSTGTEAELQERMQNFFDANYPENKLGSPYNVTLTLTEDTIDVSASTQVNTLFLKLFGKDTLDIHSDTRVIRELAGVEAVLVLDTTGSMAGTNIAALKTAATNFIDIMFDRIADTDYLRIGIVPYATTVNVGRYGIGQNPDGSYYDNGFVDNPATDEYVTPASNIVWGTATNNWWGCVIERTGEQMTDADSPNWVMYRYPRRCTRTNWYGTCISWTTPNQGCTASKLQPLTNDETVLKNNISSLPASGNTYSHIGMVWGWRVVSPDFPFTEGSEYGNQKWVKTVILMTDGDNTVDNYYSGEGKKGDVGVSATTTQQNQKLAAVCQSMKDAGVRIYTVTFQSGINETTKSYYRNCATSTSMYYDAPSDADLIEVFEKIADQLSQLHVAK